MPGKGAVRATDLLAGDSQPLVVGTHRKFAAVVALAVPTAVIPFMIFAFWDVGFAKMLGHTTLKAALIPGIIALGLWIKWYWRPALIAFRLKGHPIEILGNEVRFFGKVIPLSNDPVFRTDGRRVYVRAKDDVEYYEWKFFVKSEILGINMSPLTP